MPDVLTRSYDPARTGANTRETILTPRLVGGNLIKLKFSLKVDDPRIEAQPLYLAGVAMEDGRLHDVVYVSTMANSVWAFDANDGALLWKVILGTPIKPGPTDPPNPPANQIDIFGINVLWGILSTPVIDRETLTMYVVYWTSPDGTLARAQFEVTALDVATGQRRRPPVVIEASADRQAGPGEPPVRWIHRLQKQRPSLLLTSVDDTDGITRKTLFIAAAMTHEAGDPTHGWLLAYDTATLQQTAAWCTTPHTPGGGIWMAGQGPAADEHGFVYVITGNYVDEDQPLLKGDLPESLVKLRYTRPSGASAGKLEPVAWFTPFTDVERQFKDSDLGSSGALVLPGMRTVVASGKDGVLYVLDTEAMGQGGDPSVLRQRPIFFTYFPGFGIDAGVLANLDRLYDGKTHHLHATPAFWRSPERGPMLFCWGENECLRAWTIDADGQVRFVAKSAEVASAGAPGQGGMPGGFAVVSSDGQKPNTGIVWATAPISGNANVHVVEGILRRTTPARSTLSPTPTARRGSSSCGTPSRSPATRSTTASSARRWSPTERSSWRPTPAASTSMDCTCRRQGRVRPTSACRATCAEGSCSGNRAAPTGRSSGRAARSSCARTARSPGCCWCSASSSR